METIREVKKKNNGSEGDVIYIYKYCLREDNELMRQ